MNATATVCAFQASRMSGIQTIFPRIDTKLIKAVTLLRRHPETQSGLHWLPNSGSEWVSSALNNMSLAPGHMVLFVKIRFNMQPNGAHKNTTNQYDPEIGRLSLTHNSIWPSGYSIVRYSQT